MTFLPDSGRFLLTKNWIVSKYEFYVYAETCKYNVITRTTLQIVQTPFQSDKSNAFSKPYHKPACNR